MDSSEDKCNMNKNSTVDCTKAFVDEPEPALRGKVGGKREMEGGGGGGGQSGL